MSTQALRVFTCDCELKSKLKPSSVFTCPECLPPGAITQLAMQQLELLEEEAGSPCKGAVADEEDRSIEAEHPPYPVWDWEVLERQEVSHGESIH